MNASADWELQIRRLRLLSMEMLERAQAGEWEIVTEREAQRRDLLGELFQSPPPTQWTSLLRDAIQATLDSDGRVQELARAEMDKLSDDLRALRQGRRALNAYHNS